MEETLRRILALLEQMNDRRARLLNAFLSGVLRGGSTWTLANAKYGLDKPVPVQFVNYLKNLLHGDMGVSLKMQEGTAVTKILFGQGKFALSIKLGLWALFFAVLLGIPLGVLSAYYRGGWVDSVLRVVTTLGIAMPSFVVATLMLFEFAVELKILPVLTI